MVRLTSTILLRALHTPQQHNDKRTYTYANNNVYVNIVYVRNNVYVYVRNNVYVTSTLYTYGTMYMYLLSSRWSCMPTANSSEHSGVDPISSSPGATDRGSPFGNSISSWNKFVCIWYMCIRIYVYACTNLYVRIYICTCWYIHICIHVSPYALVTRGNSSESPAGHSFSSWNRCTCTLCVYVYICIYVHICIHIYVHKLIQNHHHQGQLIGGLPPETAFLPEIKLYIYLYLCIYVHICIYIYIYIWFKMLIIRDNWSGVSHRK